MTRRKVRRPKTFSVDLVSITHGLLAAEQRSFRRAARVLGVGQSAVSRRVRNLEDELGVSLFERHSGGARLTWAGQDFFKRVRFVVSELDHAVILAGRIGRGASGLLRIGVASSLASMFLRTLITDYVRLHPDIEIDIAEDDRREHFAQIRERRLDVLFVAGEPSEPGCETAVLWTERLFAVLPNDHQLCGSPGIGWDALRAEHFIVSQQEPGPEIHDYVVRKLATPSHQPSVARYRVGRENLMHLVGTGFGLSLANESSVASGYLNVTFRRLDGPDEFLPFSAVWAPDNDNPALRRFLSLARSMAKLSKL